jgi:hypothetical protein
MDYASTMGLGADFDDFLRIVSLTLVVEESAFSVALQF